MYIETSGSRRVNDSARIISPTISDTTIRCLNFWYNMYGVHINALNVYVQQPGQLPTLTTPKWKRSGTQGNMWKQAKLQIQQNGPYQVSLLFFGLKCYQNFLGKKTR